MEFRDLIDKYNEYINLRRTRFTETRLPSTHIEDENQSVKWNREFVENHNKLVEKHIEQYRRKVNKTFNDYIASILDSISSEINCSIEMAAEIYYYVYGIREWDDQEEDKLDAIEELVDLIKRVKGEK